MWYQNIESLVNHMRYLKFALIFVLETLMYINEMMIHFMGKSTNTHQINNKPISEGFKFLSLTQFLVLLSTLIQMGGRQPIKIHKSTRIKSIWGRLSL